MAIKGAIPYSKKDLSNNNINIEELVKKLKEIALKVKTFASKK